MTDWAPIGAAVGIVALALAIGLYAAAVLDRMVAGWISREPLRLLPVLATPFRESAILLLQQRSSTERPDAAMWAFAPAFLVALAAAALAIVPLGPTLAIEIESGIVYFGAAMAMVMVAVFLHGWSANSTFPLVGAYRFVAQALSYEMPLVLVLIAAALPAESLSIPEIVRSQETSWNVVRQPLGLPLYLIVSLGVWFSGALALPDGTDLAGGTVAEVSGTPLLLWRAAQAAVLVAVSAMGAAVFLGGWLGPWLPGPTWMTLKTLLLMLLLILAKHLTARIRLERFVVVSWTVLIPLALVDVFLSGLLALWRIGS